jgi:uncharacterized membrane protein
MHLAQITGVNNPSTRFTSSDTLVGDVVSRALLFAISLAGLYFFYVLITSGISYMTSSGDEMRLKQIQKQLVNAVYGLLIVIAAYFIIQIVQRITGTNIL